MTRYAFHTRQRKPDLNAASGGPRSPTFATTEPSTPSLILHLGKSKMTLNISRDLQALKASHLI